MSPCTEVNDGDRLRGQACEEAADRAVRRLDVRVVPGELPPRALVPRPPGHVAAEDDGGGIGGRDAGCGGVVRRMRRLEAHDGEPGGAERSAGTRRPARTRRRSGTHRSASGCGSRVPCSQGSFRRNPLSNPSQKPKPPRCLRGHHGPGVLLARQAGAPCPVGRGATCRRRPWRTRARASHARPCAPRAEAGRSSRGCRSPATATPVSIAARANGPKGCGVTACVKFTDCGGQRVQERGPRVGVAGGPERLRPPLRGHDPEDVRRHGGCVFPVLRFARE